MPTKLSVVILWMIILLMQPLPPFKMIKPAGNRVSVREKTKKSFAGLSQLPLELRLYILSLLEPWQRFVCAAVTTHCLWFQVCREWRNLVLDGSLWKSVNIHQLSPASSKSVQQNLNYIQKRVQKRKMNMKSQKICLKFTLIAKNAGLFLQKLDFRYFLHVTPEVQCISNPKRFFPVLSSTFLLTYAIFVLQDYEASALIC